MPLASLQTAIEVVKIGAGCIFCQFSRSEQKKEAAIKASHDSEMLVLRKKPNSILVYTS